MSSTDQVFLGSNRLRDGSAAHLGKFSQKRTGLKPQTEYNYSVYAMNNNLSHSTGALEGTFTTLSTAPLKQPTKFTTTTNDTAVNFEWNDAAFPKKGATKAGYLLVYSTNAPALINDANGKAPGAPSTGYIPTFNFVKPNGIDNHYYTLDPINSRWQGQLGVKYTF